jgi:hypothetical protein
MVRTKVRKACDDSRRAVEVRGARNRSDHGCGNILIDATVRVGRRVLAHQHGLALVGSESGHAIVLHTETTDQFPQLRPVPRRAPKHHHYDHEYWPPALSWFRVPSSAATAAQTTKTALLATPRALDWQLASNPAIGLPHTAKEQSCLAEGQRLPGPGLAPQGPAALQPRRAVHKDACCP